MLLFHGSNMEIKEPRLLEQTRGLDFGKGFYLTTREEQARGFADRIFDRRSTGKPTVNFYEFDEAAAKRSLSFLVFSEPDASWLEFIRDSRLKIYAGTQYDVIVGPVANDRVFPTLQALVIGQFSIEAALINIRPYKLFNQYCFASEKALSMLMHKKADTRQEGGNW